MFHTKGLPSKSHLSQNTPKPTSSPVAATSPGCQTAVIQRGVVPRPALKIDTRLAIQFASTSRSADLTSTLSKESKSDPSEPTVAATEKQAAIDADGFSMVATRRAPGGLKGPYVKAYKQATESPLFASMKEAVTQEEKGVVFRVENLEAHLARQLASLGSISRMGALLITENFFLRQFAQEVYHAIDACNTKYQRSLKTPALEDLKCMSFVQVRIKGKRRVFVTISGGGDSLVGTQLNQYLEDLAEVHGYIVAPPVSADFKKLIAAVSRQFGIPKLDFEKICSEPHVVALMAKLFFIYGKGMSIEGNVNVPIFIAHKDIKAKRLAIPREKLLAYFDFGKPWKDLEQPVHHWLCCSNCRNHRPAYLLLMAVMKNLRDKNEAVLIDEPLSPLDPSIVEQLSRDQPDKEAKEIKAETPASSPAKSAKLSEAAAGASSSASKTHACSAELAFKTGSRSPARTFAALFQNAKPVQLVAAGGPEAREPFEP